MNKAGKRFIFYIDGASRGNPGKAGAGVVVCNGKGEVIKEKKVYLGQATNNVAEYRAFLLALQEACALRAREIEVYTDSELLVRQWNGRYRVRNPRLISLFEQARALCWRLEGCCVTYIPREQNKRADQLANQAINNHL